jgi:hypothetical protein
MPYSSTVDYTRELRAGKVRPFGQNAALPAAAAAAAAGVFLRYICSREWRANMGEGRTVDAFRALLASPKGAILQDADQNLMNRFRVEQALFVGDDLKGMRQFSSRMQKEVLASSLWRNRTQLGPCRSVLR